MSWDTPRLRKRQARIAAKRQAHEERRAEVQALGEAYDKHLEEILAEQKPCEHRFTYWCDEGKKCSECGALLD